MTHQQTQILAKFCVYMALSLVLMILTAYFTAFGLLEILADIAGSKALIIWLMIIFASAVTAFIIRKRIWHMKTLTLIVILTIYSITEGIMFSVLFLGDSVIAVVIVSVIFILAILADREKAMKRKGDVSNTALAWALSAHICVMMVISLWVLIWGAWDTTKRRYSRHKGGK